MSRRPDWISKYWKEAIEKAGYSSRQEMLQDLYINKKWPVSKIASLVKHDKTDVIYHMKKYGIQRRSRGGNNNPTGRKYVEQQR